MPLSFGQVFHCTNIFKLLFHFLLLFPSFFAFFFFFYLTHSLKIGNQKEHAVPGSYKKSLLQNCLSQYFLRIVFLLFEQICVCFMEGRSFSHEVCDFSLSDNS